MYALVFLGMRFQYHSKISSNSDTDIAADDGDDDDGNDDDDDALSGC
jgi:hypothetical protein